jgi:uncharacterized glyoxalase superfamily protein PhnB
MPSAGFKDRLKEDLKRRASMSVATVNPIREGFRTVTPYVIARQGAELIDFVKQAFDAQELLRTTGSAGGIHCELRIGDSVVMMGGGGAYQGPGAPAALHYFVENPDEVYERALRFGAISVYEPMEEHGERFACIKDAFGNEWYIARSLGPRYVPEGLRDINVYFHPVGVPKFIDFLKRVFAAEQVALHESPDGVVVHAKFRIGDSIIEMGEAHGQWQPLPSVIYLYVPNVDEVYRRAIQAGGISLYEPADQPYGDRNAGVVDPFGHTWYISTHIKDVTT